MCLSHTHVVMQHQPACDESQKAACHHSKEGVSKPQTSTQMFENFVTFGMSRSACGVIHTSNSCFQFPVSKNVRSLSFDFVSFPIVFHMSNFCETIRKGLINALNNVLGRSLACGSSVDEIYRLCHATAGCFVISQLTSQRQSFVILSKVPLSNAHA